MVNGLLTLVATIVICLSWTRINTLDNEVKKLRKELNTERTQRTSADYSIGSRFDTIIGYLTNK